MNLSKLALDELKEIITGDNELSPNLSGPKLVSLFNEFGFNDEYSGGLPGGVSRNSYTLDRMKQLNGTDSLARLFERVFHHGRFMVARKNIDEAVSCVNYFIEPDGYRIELREGVYKVLQTRRESIEDVTVEAYFENIQSKIIEHLNSAKFLIWVAVAWFTDETLYEKLIEKKNEGLVIQVIIADKPENDNYYERHKSHFQFCKLPALSEDNRGIMHHKFCVIDLEKVITGSYNWTVAAATRNIENVIVVDKSDEIKEYAQEFINLRKMCLELRR